MERNETSSNAPNRKEGQSFAPVFDSRKRKIVGLRRRGSRYYAQLRVDLGNGRTAPRRIALEAANLDGAKAELEHRRAERRDGKLPRTGQRPRFEDFARAYFDSASFAEKKIGTQKLGRWAIGRRIEHLGGIRIDKITPAHFRSYRESRLKLGRAARMANLDTVALRNVLKLGVERELLERFPETRQLRQKPTPKRALLSKACR